MARLNNPYLAGVFLSFFVNDFEKRNFKIPNGNKCDTIHEIISEQNQKGGKK